MGPIYSEAVIRSVAIIALLWGAAYLGWRAVDTWERTEPALFLLLYACELFGWAMLVSFCFLAWRIPVSKRPPIDRPHSVEVLVCTYDEGLDVLEATLLGCAGITYPHVTWVLDDGRRESVRVLAERTGARYVTRPDNRHAKAGNINHALDVVDGELLLILDADHVPQPDILDATVGYFDDPTMAVVQTPHDFGNHDSFQHFETGRHDQSMFFEVILPGKDRHNGVFWCGSAAVIRRAALVEVGGVATETIAEDFHTTIKMHGRGLEDPVPRRDVGAGSRSARPVVVPAPTGSLGTRESRGVSDDRESPARRQSVARPAIQLLVVAAGLLRAAPASRPPDGAYGDARERTATHARHPVRLPRLLAPLDRGRPCGLDAALPGTSHPVGWDVLRCCSRLGSSPGRPWRS